MIPNTQEYHRMKQNIANFYVDESGDMTLFNKKGIPIIDKEGVSKTFMLGVARITNNIEEINTKFENLRFDLLSDPCLKGIPSLQKTSLYFHAKDDCAAVRREIFKLLQTINVRVTVIVKRKYRLLKEAQSLFEYMGEKLSEKRVYSTLVSRLFKSLLHKNNENHIIFAKRGKTFNNLSLNESINKAVENCYKSWGIKNENNISIESSHPSNYIGLQIIDYFLWALHRLYEKNDGSFYSILQDKYSLIMDIDDTRNKPYGEWYTRNKPLELNKLKIL